MCPSGIIYVINDIQINFIFNIRNKIEWFTYVLNLYLLNI